MTAKRDECILLIVDVQEKLIGTVVDKQSLLENLITLGKVSQKFQIPILVSEQEKLGRTVPELREAVMNQFTFMKLAFSCCQNEQFMRRLDELGRKTIIICGIEAHICVEQTVLDLIERGYNVHLIIDAVSSYSAIDRETSVERMRDAGAVITTTEAVIYEIMEKAGTTEFTEILQIVKERRRNISNVR